MKTQIIIVAGGSGQRMKSKLAKQFLTLNGKPILMHTIEQFSFLQSEIVLVLPEAEIPTWEELVEKHDFKIPVKIIKGGKERFFSVKNALSACSNNGVILIHDGVRPLVSETTIQNIIAKATESKSAVPFVDINESVRELTKISSRSVDRSKFKLIQTPQGFDAKLIKESYEQDYSEKFTDDASVFENKGYDIHLVAGNKENIKITTPLDLDFANYILQK